MSSNSGIEDRQSLRERVYGTATGGRDGRRSLLGALFAVSLFFLIAALSARQVTARENAVPLLRAGVAVVTGVDQLIETEAAGWRESATTTDEQTITLPGYPLDVALSREELLRSDNPGLVKLVLDRSAALVYADGLDAFDRTGEQSLDRFSAQGALELAVGQLSQDTHDRAGIATALAALLAAVFGSLFAASSLGWARLRGPGFVAALAAVPALLLFGGAWWVAGRLGGSDPFVSELRDISRAAFEVPVRNAFVLFLAGVAIVATAAVLGRLERNALRTGPAPATDEEFAP